MSQHTPVRWIVAYDIADRKRWARLYKLLKTEGVPIQLSVFSVTASAEQMSRLMSKVKALIDPKADDVRAYRVPEWAHVHQLGQPILPDDVWIEG